MTVKLLKNNWRSKAVTKICSRHLPRGGSPNSGDNSHMKACKFLKYLYVEGNSDTYRCVGYVIADKKQ